jgi:hypothetical protein
LTIIQNNINTQKIVNVPFQNTIIIFFQFQVRAHWLVIDGVQPNIPENPAPVKKPPTELPFKKLPEDLKDDKNKDKNKLDKKNTEKTKSSGIIEQKPLLRHELSVEQMKYYQGTKLWIF